MNRCGYRGCVRPVTALRCPKCALHERRTRKAERSRAELSAADTIQTKINRPSNHLVIKDGHVRRVPGWTDKS
jgi:hypothetical protein